MRARVEKIFGTWKRCYGLRRMRWRGIAKAAIQGPPHAIAYNLKRTLTIVANHVRETGTFTETRRHEAATATLGRR